MGVRERVSGSVGLTRPGNAFAGGTLTLIGSFVAGGLLTSPVAVGAAVGSTMMGVAAGNTINDYFDREIDAINRPNRPLPSGAVTPRWALGQSGVLFVLAIGLALTLPPLAIGIAVFNLLLLITYTQWFKGTPGVGNAVVAFLGGSTFLYGGAAVGAVETTVVLFVLAAMATLGREIIKDVEDVTGDEEMGARTLPIVMGERFALRVAAVTLGIAVLASPLPYLLGTFGLGYLIVVFPGVLAMALGAWSAFSNPGRGQRLVKLGMFVAIAAFMIDRATVLVTMPGF